MSELSQAIQEGLSVTQAAAVCGLCRSDAYREASALGLVRARPPFPATRRRRILELIERGGLSLAAIAAVNGCNKSRVIRIRDLAAGLDRGFRRTRSAYTCPTCGRRIQVAPCVACQCRRAGY